MPVTRSSLLARLRQDDSGASWREFTALYQPLIERFARTAGISGSDIDDVVQDVLIQLLRALPSFAYRKERGHFRQWLRRITVNKSIDVHRKSARSPVPHACVDDVPEDSRGIESSWTREFRLQLVRAALQHIRPDVRPRTWDCFAGHVLQQRSAAEVSRQVGVSENAVYVNSTRVIARVREFCAFHGEDLEDGHTRLPW